MKFLIGLILAVSLGGCVRHGHTVYGPHDLLRDRKNHAENSAYCIYKKDTGMDPLGVFCTPNKVIAKDWACIIVTPYLEISVMPIKETLLFDETLKRHHSWAQ